MQTNVSTMDRLSGSAKRHRQLSSIKTMLTLSLRWGLGVLLLVSCSGCIPILDKTPRIGGTVVTAETQQPIADAKVQLQQSPPGEGAIATIMTQTNGTFQLPQKRFWRVVPLIGDLKPKERRVVIEAQGYGTFTASTWERSTNFGVILLKRTAP